MGFTLIELLTVMTIIGLLLTIALPRYFSALEKSKERVLKENLRVTRTQIDRFFADRSRYPQSLQELVTEKYLQSVPVDPITASADTWTLIAPTDSNAPGIADIKSGASGMALDGSSFDSL
jgi:general secretion pathway protein G